MGFFRANGNTNDETRTTPVGGQNGTSEPTTSGFQVCHPTCNYSIMLQQNQQKQNQCRINVWTDGDLKYQTCLPKQTKHKTVHKGSVANSMVYLGDNSCSTMRAAHWYRHLFENYWLWKRDNRLLNHCCWLHSWYTISSLKEHSTKKHWSDQWWNIIHCICISYISTNILECLWFSLAGFWQPFS